MEGFRKNAGTITNASCRPSLLATPGLEMAKCPSLDEEIERLIRASEKAYEELVNGKIQENEYVDRTLQIAA